MFALFKALVAKFRPVPEDDYGVSPLLGISPCICPQVIWFRVAGWIMCVPSSRGAGERRCGVGRRDGAGPALVS